MWRPGYIWESGARNGLVSSPHTRRIHVPLEKTSRKTRLSFAPPSLCTFTRAGHHRDIIKYADPSGVWPPTLLCSIRPTCRSPPTHIVDYTRLRVWRRACKAIPAIIPSLRDPYPCTRHPCRTLGSPHAAGSHSRFLACPFCVNRINPSWFRLALLAQLVGQHHEWN